MYKNFQRISHSRDILCAWVQSLQGVPVQTTYTIPRYGEPIPSSQPTVTITEENIIITFNQDSQQNYQIQSK
jgi:hypothetical protein